jgi:proline iminopeptidase
VLPEENSLQSEIADPDAVCAYFRLESVALLGRSWGGLLAMEYAIRHPERVSRLILMNARPASYDDYMLFRQNRSVSASDDIAQLQALAATEGHAQRDPEKPRAVRAPGPEVRPTEPCMKS